MKAITKAYEVHQKNDDGDDETVYVRTKAQVDRMITCGNVGEVQLVTFTEDAAWRLLNAQGGYIATTKCIYVKP